MIYGGLGGEPGAYTSTDQRGRFMTSLGFTIPAAIDGLATPEEAYFVGISKENYRMFDTDVAVIVGSTADPAAAIAAEPLYGDLANVREGRAIFLDELNGVWAAALAYDSPLSLPYTLDNFVPALAAAADKNPGARRSHGATAHCGQLTRPSERGEPDPDTGSGAPRHGAVSPLSAPVP